MLNFKLFQCKLDLCFDILLFKLISTVSLGVNSSIFSGVGISFSDVQLPLTALSAVSIYCCDTSPSLIYVSRIVVCTIGTVLECSNSILTLLFFASSSVFKTERICFDFIDLTVDISGSLGLPSEDESSLSLKQLSMGSSFS